MSLSSGSLRTTGLRMAAMPAKSVHKQIFRALLTFSSATLLVRVFGMLNQIVVTRRFGAGATMDAYFVASTLPLLMATLLSASIESSVIPVYTQVRAQGNLKVGLKDWAAGAGDIGHLPRLPLGKAMLDFQRKSNAFYQVLSTRSHSNLLGVVLGYPLYD